MTSLSALSAEPVRAAPKKPQRTKSGLQSPTSPRPHVDNLQRSQSLDADFSLFFEPDEEGKTVAGEAKWFALNDEEPETTKKRLKRIVRSYSDSELSEASTIDSSGANDRAARRRRIKERKDAMTQRRNERRKQRAEKKRLENPEEAPTDGHADEDDDLVDTDQDVPGISKISSPPSQPPPTETPGGNPLGRSSSHRSLRREKSRSRRRGGGRAGEDRSLGSSKRPRRRKSKEQRRRSSSASKRRSVPDENATPRPLRRGRKKDSNELPDSIDLSAHKIDPEKWAWNKDKEDESIASYLERIRNRRDAYKSGSPEHSI